MNKTKHYTPPKFKKRDLVNSPAGEGTIELIVYQGGGHFYKVNDSFYAEGEISKV